MLMLSDLLFLQPYISLESFHFVVALLHQFLIASGLSINVHSFSSKEESSHVIHQEDGFPNVFLTRVPKHLVNLRSMSFHL